MSSSDSMSFYKARTTNELLQLQLKEVHFLTTHFPRNVSQFDCIYPEKRLPLLNKCSLTNETKDFDVDVVSACENWTGSNKQVYDAVNANIYSNIFCAICNKMSYPTMYSKCHCLDGAFNIKPLPFHLLLNIKQTERVKPNVRNSISLFKTSNCSSDEWRSPDGHCLQLYCSAGKKLRSNECTEILEEIKGLRYRLSLWMIPLYSDQLNGATINTVMDEMVTKIEYMLNYLSRSFEFQLYTFQSQNKTTMEIAYINRMECIVIGTNKLTRNELEDALLHKFWNANISVETNTNETYVLKSYLEVLSLGIQHSYMKDGMKIFNKTSSLYFEVSAKTSISITNVLLCQHLKFPVKKYQKIIDYNFLPPNIRITLDLNVTKLNITDLKDFSMVEIDEDGGLNVCQDLLDSKLKEADKDNIHQDLLNRNLKGTSLAEYIVSISCFAASIVCLLTTLLAYFMFPVLRTEAGINNMFLSCSLLLAQISLLISSHIYRSSVMCTILGLTTHFQWLWMFSWSFICSYHMFRVFTANTTRPTLRNNLAGLWRKIVISLIFPISIVCITIVYSYLTSAGEDIGYGLFSCYLNSTLLIGVTLICPLSVVTVTNIIFFLITVYKIYKVRRLQSSLRTEDQQTQWYVYVRLSSVTGAFWVVAIIGEAVDSNILKFISIILNGLQGVAIFVSFICNKRVWHFYNELRKRDTTLNTTS